MNEKSEKVKLLLVDDEADFRTATRKALERRGFEVIEAANGVEALKAIPKHSPEIIVLDLVMPVMTGIETLVKIREVHKKLPVIILTGHGTFHDAIAGIKMEIVDFLQKPVDIDLLITRIRKFLALGTDHTLRERTISELMISPSLYPKLYTDQPVKDAVEKLLKSFFPDNTGEINTPRFRTAIIYNRNEEFIGLIRFPDLLKLVLPSFLRDSDYSSLYTGMFLAQCKMIGQRNIYELVGKHVSVDVDDPLIWAVHLMIENHIITIPVLKAGELVGILREKDIILEITKHLGLMEIPDWYLWY